MLTPCAVLCSSVFCLCLQELSDQQLKQMLLAYMVLIMKGRAMKQEDLDNACEVRPCPMAGISRTRESCRGSVHCSVYERRVRVHVLQNQPRGGRPCCMHVTVPSRT